MKFTLTTVALMATAVLAAPHPAADPWCTRPGEPCWKRNAAPEPTAAPEAAPEAEAEPWCSRPGEPCWKDKREAAPEPTAAPEAAPKAEPDPWCTRPGEPCWKDKREAAPEPEAEPEADAEADPEAWCKRPGEPCWKAKRSAEAEAWCKRPGEPCWKVKRAAEAFAESIGSSGKLQARSAEAELSNFPGGSAFFAKRGVDELAHLVSLSDEDTTEYYKSLNLEDHFHEDTEDTKEKREANPDPWCKRPGEPCWKRDVVELDKKWCTRPGEPCWKAKRAADAVLDAVDAHAVRDLGSQSFNPEFAKRDALAAPWCKRPGEPCWKRDAQPDPDAEAEAWCKRPGEPCWKAKRDLHAIRIAARGILEDFQ